jgi:transcription factor CP2-like protein
MTADGCHKSHSSPTNEASTNDETRQQSPLNVDKRQTNENIRETASNHSPLQLSIMDVAASDVSGFRFSLDAPVSTLQLYDEDKITYLNKGQYYRLSMEYRSSGHAVKSNQLKSIVMVLFGDNITVGDELEAWRLWHSRQPSFKQRILDIDYKNSSGVSPNSMEELAYNATSVVWSPLDQPVKVNVAVNCLSTDFSNQKGVKGIPLHIQIDTYDNSDPTGPRIHRAICKIKIFCEKGAERKVRDEERKRNVTLITKKEPMGLATDDDDQCSRSTGLSNFRTVIDNNKVPVLFTPANDVPCVAKSPIDKKPRVYSSSQDTSHIGRLDDVAMLPRRHSCDTLMNRETRRVLLYVREQHEVVFTALELPTPTVPALIQAIEEMYSQRPGKILNVFRKSKKGLLVRMDDKTLKHYIDESAFVISTSTSALSSSLPVSDGGGNGSLSGNYDVILTEIDAEESL